MWASTYDHRVKSIESETAEDKQGEAIVAGAKCSIPDMGCQTQLQHLVDQCLTTPRTGIVWLLL